jgi:hypothetical protein
MSPVQSGDVFTRSRSSELTPLSDNRPATSPATGHAARPGLPAVLAATALSLATVLAILLVLLDHGASRSPAHPGAATRLVPSPARARVVASKWRLELYDNFRSGLTGVDWALYSGQALGDPGGFFAPGHVSIVHGTLNIAAYRDPGFGDRWVSGGVTTIPAVRQIYGKYLVRARIDPGEGIIGAVVLWPLHGSAPPEINLAKNVGYNTVRNEFTASLLPTGGLEVTRSIGVDWSDWHTIGLEWTPRRLVFLLDGRPWASIRGGGVPSVPMRLAIQSQAATCTSDSTCPGSVTPANVRFQVAWVRIYAYRGPR